ncbi:ArsR family transcriptional regulator [Methanotrichaceae archaeon M04Ac]|jgi:predicted transcriptional regulator|uniref:ArsR family transcriptional regulator n=1 Tax=Candidatus Methanocrinis alkalitolerans TaxID=3033395 RepID=A0ABT5XDV1_9EURY|nr:ArsR family transcriptional regulator [Candidatus Methanocrinis alkalitolerans]MCR3883586.1 ArsR family transcriptional regulator [Methanothrix sp.]MDF0592890.1 ArsR family transcriptional regulator [Candidatus Methanocrinis alkalitolerans]
MRQFSVKVLDDADREFVEVLRDLGIPRNVASMITYLANVQEATSREIEIGSNLRQPEVSIAMRTLRNNGWVEEREIKKDGKGRPMKVYRLTITLEEIITHFEEEKRRESARVMENIGRLKDLSGKLSNS